MKNKLELNNNLVGKKLLILGGNPETGVLVEYANNMGVKTIVVDPNPHAPAKKYACKSFDIDGFNIKELAKVAIDENVDGVLVGVADILVSPYLDLCKELNLPSYATEKIVEALTTKDGFIKACEQYGIKSIPYFNLDEKMSKADLLKIQYPVMIKPVDNGGGVGMTICENERELKRGVAHALENSRKNRFITERYMNCDDIVAYYTISDGKVYLSAIADRITSKKQGKASPVCISSIYPSKHWRLFLDLTHPKVVQMLNGLGVKDGVLAIQFFVENSEFYAYDPGFRLQGEAMHIYINHINGFDHRAMLINFALTGTMGISDLSDINDYKFHNKHACTFWILLKEGLIKEINGIEELASDPAIIYVLQRFFVGDIVEAHMVGNEKQVLARIYIVTESSPLLVDKIKEIKSSLRVVDSKGESMIIDMLDISSIPINLS